MLLESLEKRGIELVAGGGRNGKLDSQTGAGDRQAARHIVRVADKGELQSLQPSAYLRDGEQVGQCLTGVIKIGQSVDDGAGGMSRQGLDT